MARIVTITSDFGWKDYYLAVIKGAILCESTDINLVDITHEIDTYDIVHAAFVIRNTWHSFPHGTIHIISVNDFGNAGGNFIAIRQEGQYFLGPDNGIFSLIFPNTPAETYQLPTPAELPHGFLLRQVYAQAVAHIVHERPFREIGTPQTSIVKRLSFQPVLTHSRIQGAVIHVDNYENVIINISRELFDKVGHGRPFGIYFKRHDPITKLSNYYQDVPVGEVLSFFNSAGYLEIAINMGKASSLLDLKLEDSVQIDFS